MDLSALDPRLIDLLPVGVFACDAPDGTIRWYNRRAAELWGRAPVCGRETPADVMRMFGGDGAMLPAGERPIEVVLATGSPVRDRELIAAFADGRRRNVLVSAEPLRQDDGEISGAVAVLQDVTEREEAEAETVRLHSQVAAEQDRRWNILHELEESQERLRLAVEAADLGTWDFDPVEGTLNWSARCKALFGLPPEAEVNYELFLRGLHPDDRRRVHETVQVLLDSGGHARFSVQYRTLGLQDGVLRWLAAEGRAYFDADGRAVRFIGTVHDITERKRLGAALRSREEQFRTLVEQSPLSIQIVSPEGRTLQVNQAWEELWGLCLEDLAGYNMLEDRQLEELGVMPYIRRAFAGQAVNVPPVRYDRRRTLPHAVGADDDPVRWVRAYAYPVHDAAGRIHNVVLIHEDVTARKRLEDELRDRVAELAEAARHKDQFLSMLAHELRNPIAALANALQVMELSTSTTPAYMRARAAAHRQVRHQRRLVDDLLDVSRIDRGKVQIRIEPVDLAQLARDTIEDHRPSLEQAELAIRTELPAGSVWVEGDATRLAQVLSNLLDNAVKFTPAGGAATVRLSAGAVAPPAVEGDVPTTATGTGSVRLEVSDTGIGLDPSIAPYLFEPFRQADATLDRSRGGLGLGLALVRGLIELHGGTVSASSEGAGRGSTFVVRLPALVGEPPLPVVHGAAPAARVPVKELAIPGLSSEPLPETFRRVIIIEDNRDAAESLRDLLELAGYRVAVAFNGPEGLTLVRRYPESLVLCDIGLPGMDGYAVASELRRNPETARTPLVALTGYGGVEAQERARAAGFDLHLVKPVEPPELQRVIRELLECEEPWGTSRRDAETQRENA